MGSATLFFSAGFLLATMCRVFGRRVHLQMALRIQWDKNQKNNSLFLSPSICRPTGGIIYALLLLLNKLMYSTL